MNKNLNMKLNGKLEQETAQETEQVTEVTLSPKQDGLHYISLTLLIWDMFRDTRAIVYRDRILYTKKTPVSDLSSSY